MKGSIQTTRCLSQKSVSASMSLSRDSHLQGCSSAAGTSRSPEKTPARGKPQEEPQRSGIRKVSSAEISTRLLQHFGKLCRCLLNVPDSPNILTLGPERFPCQSRPDITQQRILPQLQLIISLISADLFVWSVSLCSWHDAGIMGLFQWDSQQPGQRGLRCCKPNPATLHF